MTQTLQDHIHYDPKTGLFTWTYHPRNKRLNGQPALNTFDGRYLVGNFLGKMCYAHQMAFLYMIGRKPYPLCDHINRIKTDNRWCNLREVTPHENLLNRDGMLTAQQAIEIRHSTLPVDVLAKKFNVTFTLIWGIQKGRSWKWVEDQ